MRAEFKLPLKEDSYNSNCDNEALTIIAYNNLNEIGLILGDREIVVDKNDLKAIINIA